MRKSSWKSNSIWFAILVFIAGALIFAYVRWPPEPSEVENRLRDRVLGRVSAFSADELATFKWYQICVINPLTSPAQLRQVTGGKFKSDYSWFLDDSYWTLAFVVENMEVVVFPIRRFETANPKSFGCRGKNARLKLIFAKSNGLDYPVEIDFE